MARTVLWLVLVVLLLGTLFLREPRLAQTEESFLKWLLQNSDVPGAAAPLTVVEMGTEAALHDPTSTSLESSSLTPLEFALFLQSVLSFQPTVVAFETILKWRENEKGNEQVFIDQAMRVPLLLLGAELTKNPDPDAPGPEIPGFTQVKGKRGDLVEFSGIGRQPNEEIRLLGTAGFVNLPDEVADDVHVPLLFRYRGEVIPSFAFEAILLWLRVTPAEVAIDLDSHISLPQGRRIPIRPDGTLLVSRNAIKKARRMTLSELLVAAQQRDAGQKKEEADSLRDQIVLARTPANPLSPPDLLAATIATIQTNAYVRRASWIFDYVFLLLAAVVIGSLGKVSRVTLILGAIAFTAAYCLISLSLISRWLLWLPGVLPIGTVWLLVLITILIPHRSRVTRDVIAVSPPTP